MKMAKTRTTIAAIPSAQSPHPQTWNPGSFGKRPKDGDLRIGRLAIARPTWPMHRPLLTSNRARKRFLVRLEPFTVADLCLPVFHHRVRRKEPHHLRRPLSVAETARTVHVAYPCRSRR
jgi:hypothetical protein